MLCLKMRRPLLFKVSTAGILEMISARPPLTAGGLAQHAHRPPGRRLALKDRKCSSDERRSLMADGMLLCRREPLAAA